MKKRGNIAGTTDCVNIYLKNNMKFFPYSHAKKQSYFTIEERGLRRKQTYVEQSWKKWLSVFGDFN